MSKTITFSCRTADVAIHLVPASSTDKEIICIFCQIPAGTESYKCQRCGEYKGLMTTAEARSAGYQVNEEL